MESIFWQFALIGFLAQFVDGALGMAYGVISTTFLLSAGIPPAAASASVHAAKVFTAVASGLSHLLMGNVDRRLFVRLSIAGMAGAIAGAAAVSLISSPKVKLVIAAYLAVMGGVILVKGLKARPRHHTGVEKTTALLGFAGGFCDGAGGGGWGPIVTSTLLNKGHLPRLAIGTVSLSELFVSFSAVLTFLITIGIGHWRIVLGLIVGGSAAAPLAAYFCRRLPPRMMMLIVGVVVLILCIRTMVLAFTDCNFFKSDVCF